MTEIELKLTDIYGSTAWRINEPISLIVGIIFLLGFAFINIDI